MYDFLLFWIAPRVGWLSIGGMFGIAIAAGAVLRAVAGSGTAGGALFVTACGLAIVAIDYQRNR